MFFEVFPCLSRDWMRVRQLCFVVLLELQKCAVGSAVGLNGINNNNLVFVYNKGKDDINPL